MEKKTQKGAGKQQQSQQQQQRPGTEQVRSGTHIQKGESEKIQQPKPQHQQKVKK
jgi:hypothetical protein